jgi:uncharacterized protein YegP (UPF0339 family)
VVSSVADERIKDIGFADHELVVALTDGRTLAVPLVWYPRLLNASEEQRRDWRLIGDGEGVHWPQIDEDLSAAGLLRGVPAPASETSNEAGSTLQGTTGEATVRRRGQSFMKRYWDDLDFMPNKFQIYKDSEGKYRWQLSAANGDLIAHSNEGYSSKDSCRHAIDFLKQQAASAAVVELPLLTE